MISFKFVYYFSSSVRLILIFLAPDFTIVSSQSRICHIRHNSSRPLALTPCRCYIALLLSSLDQLLCYILPIHSHPISLLFFSFSIVFYHLFFLCHIISYSIQLNTI